MRKLNISTVITLLLFLGCNRLPQGYLKYQTFDEYSLKGVNILNNNLKKPFVGINVKKDTIFVLLNKVSGKSVFYKYIKFGDYWFNLRKFQQQYDPNCKCDTTPHFTERYIYKDTIMEYEYYLEHGIKKIGEHLIFLTKNDINYLSSLDGFPITRGDKFSQLKNYITVYQKKIISSNSTLSKNQHYSKYLKVLKKDTMFIYYQYGTESWKKGTLIDKRKLNSLGEFDPDKGTSILNEN